MMFEEKENPKLRKDNRVLVLRQIEGQKKLNSTGMVDNRLFTGENNLLACLDPGNCLWSLRYNHGIMQQSLKGQFTSFKAAYDAAQNYYKKRGVEIVEVLD
jgi:hypothetical protein